MISPEEIRADLSCLPADANARLHQSYGDEFVHRKFTEIKHSPAEEEDTQRAQLDTYLAAAYAIFPEEARIIQDSIKAIRHD